MQRYRLVGTGPHWAIYRGPNRIGSLDLHASGFPEWTFNTPDCVPSQGTQRRLRKLAQAPPPLPSPPDPALVTGGSGRWPIVDRHGRQLRVGDRIRAKCCVGRYGQTRIIETTLTTPHWDLCFLCAEGCVVPTKFDHHDHVLRCADVFHDYEHGHETWAEVIK